MSAPLGRWIAEPLDTDAAGQAAFYGCFDKIGREEGERDGHVDLPNATLLAHAKLYDRGYPTRDHIIEPPTTSADCADQSRPALELFRANVASLADRFDRSCLHGRSSIVDRSSLSLSPKKRGPFHLVPVIANATLERLS